jgi:Phosphatidylethanolamine-binding protein
MHRIATTSRPRQTACLRWIGNSVALAGLLILSCCTNPVTPFPGLPRLAVKTEFLVENLCDAGVSPKIALSQVPDGTASYVLQMTDIDVLLDSQWRETVPLSSRSEIPEGAAKTYAGPCIGDNVRFPPTAIYGYRYRVEVLAQAANGNPLAYGATVVYVQSAYLTARRQRQRLQQGGAGAPAPIPPPENPTMPFGAGLPGIAPNYGVIR